MTTRTLRNANDHTEWGSYIRGLGYPVTVSAVAGDDRTLAQNKLSHRWYAEIAQHRGEDATEVKTRCKLEYGIPILAADDATWAGTAVALDDVFYSEALKIVYHLPVTSRMTVSQMQRYMDTVQRVHLQQGIALTDPEARKYEGAL